MTGVRSGRWTRLALNENEVSYMPVIRRRLSTYVRVSVINARSGEASRDISSSLRHKHYRSPMTLFLLNFNIPIETSNFGASV